MSDIGFTDDDQWWVQKYKSNAIDKIHLDRLKELNIKPYDFFDNVDDWSKLSEFSLTYDDVEWVQKYTYNPIKKTDLDRLLEAKSDINPEY